MSTKLQPGVYDCYDKIAPDEPFFVLRANDPSAVDTVRYWADNARAAGHDDEKIMEASICADSMDTWRALRQTQDEAIGDQEKLFALDSSLKLFGGVIDYSDKKFHFVSSDGKERVEAVSLRALIERMPKDDIPF